MTHVWCIYSDQVSNFQLMRDIGLTSRLLHILKDTNLSEATIDTITNVIYVLLQGPPDQHGLLRYINKATLQLFVFKRIDNYNVHV